MLTEQEPDQELPRRRRELYRTIIDLLLAGGWATTEGHIDRAACRAILQQWAWDAVKDAVTPAGLGVWPETITTKRTTPHVSAAMERALDNVAPKQEHPHSSHYDHEQVERRFLHRTLWEYLVSEHIATFSAAKAAKALLPHIWFDPDWNVTLPMTIAAHKKRSKLVDRLWAYHTDRPTLAQEVVNKRLEKLLLEVAAQTDPKDWTKANQARIRALRDNFAPHHPELITSSAHWGDINHVEAILAVLLCAYPRRGPELVRGLLELVLTDAEREKACQAIIKTLPNINPREIIQLIKALSRLEPTEAERAKARQAIIKTLPNNDPWNIDKPINALLRLEPTEAERAKARQAIIKTLAAESYRIPNLLHKLLTLDPNNEEQAETRQAIITALPHADTEEIHYLINALSKLEPTNTEQAKARHTIITALPNNGPWNIDKLINTLLRLEPTNTERTKARQTVLTVLSEAGPVTFYILVRLLRRLTSVNDWLAALGIESA